MELKIIESSQNKLVFQLIGADHTLCNALKKQLLAISGVDIATYAVEHPQIGIPKMQIETSGKTTPKSALQKAITALQAQNKEFLKNFN